MKKKTQKAPSRSEQSIICSNPLFSMAHAMVEAAVNEDENVKAILLPHLIEVLIGLSRTGIYGEREDDRRMAQELTVAILDEYVEHLTQTVVTTSQ